MEQNVNHIQFINITYIKDNQQMITFRTQI